MAKIAAGISAVSILGLGGKTISNYIKNRPREPKYIYATVLDEKESTEGGYTLDIETGGKNYVLGLWCSVCLSADKVAKRDAIQESSKIRINKKIFDYYLDGIVSSVGYNDITVLEK